MAAVYFCPTCGEKHDLMISNTRVSYMSGNRIVTLESENQECDNCLKKMEAAQEKARAEIKKTRPVLETI